MQDLIDAVRSAVDALVAHMPSVVIDLWSYDWVRFLVTALVFVAVGLWIGRRGQAAAPAQPAGFTIPGPGAAPAKPAQPTVDTEPAAPKKIEKDLKERGLPDTEIADRLREFPAKLRELKDAVGSFRVEDQSLKPLLDDAWKILDEGELRRAVNMLFYVVRNSSDMARSERQSAEKHLSTAAVVWALAGDLEMTQAEYASAGEFYRQSLSALADNADGVSAKLLEKRGFAAYRGYEFLTAVEAVHRAVEVLEKTLGKEHADLASALNNLGLVHTAGGGLEQAEAVYRRALAIDEKTLGPNHPGVAADLNNLGLLYKKQGKLADADAALKRSISIKEKVFEPHHPSMAGGLRTYIALLREMKREEEARALEARLPKPAAAAAAQ